MSRKATQNESDPSPEELLNESAEPGEDGRDVEETLDSLRAERDEYLGHWRRAQADYQNLKRRTSADIEAALRRSEQPLLEDVLLVLDYLDMATATPCTTEEAKNVLTGVELTRSQLRSVLERQDVRPIDTSGEFDPGLHQAIATVETTEAEPGAILETVRSGWTHRGTVLRFAQVKVAAAPSDVAE